MDEARKSTAAPTFTQAQIELATGFSREVLRKWELRFGFPLPTRDPRGRRMYSLKDLQRLQLIKQLLSLGHRPRHLIGLTYRALSRLLASNATVATPQPCQLSTGLLATLTGDEGPPAVDEYLRKRLKRVGLESFVANDMPVFNEAVGNAWASGSLGIYGEHVFTASVRRIVQEKVSELRPPPGAAKVLLTTPTGEPHGLGILALQAALAAHGAQCIELGVQTPEASVVDAAAKWDVSIVCISISDNMPSNTALAYVATLRALLQGTCRLWIGGQGAAAVADAIPAGVLIFDTIQAAVEEWRALTVSKGRTNAAA